MDALRDEALRNIISQVEDKNFGGLRDRARWRSTFPISRIVLLLIALAAGGMAAFLATRSERTIEQPAGPVLEVVQAASIQVLVANQAIGPGERLTEASLGWMDWPPTAAGSGYITSETAPDAVASMAGAVARREIFAGEPISMEKLSLAGQGFLSAVLDAGQRGVSVTVAAESASGGFVVPNDHVDVVLTRTAEGGQVSEIILQNVRVLAVGTSLGESARTGAPADAGDQRADVFSDETIATLALDPGQAEVIINATAVGRLSLVLRSVFDFADVAPTDEDARNEAIRITSPFWAR